MNAVSLPSCHRSAPAEGFTAGTNVVAKEGGSSKQQGMDPLMDFAILRLQRGQIHREKLNKETVFVLFDGKARVRIGTQALAVQRRSVFEEGPFVLHAGIGESVEIPAGVSNSEWAVIRTTNSRALAPRVYSSSDYTSEDRGAGLVQGACRRIVRTVFDYSTRPESNLVVGEVVNFPGRWSSYPPHHHPQPEIYHYRFSLRQGYGHAELGDTVLKVRQGDTVLIPGGLDHAQVSAPGYAMYYLWVVRHLPRRPYRGFTFTDEHRWLLDPKKQGWQPKSLASS